MYSIWLITRSLYYAKDFPPLEFTSNGRDHLRHWGVIVSELSIIDIQVIMQRSRGNWGTELTSLGTLYELFRDGSQQNTVNVIRPFHMGMIREDWRGFSSQYIGLSDMTHEMIEQEGRRCHS